VKRAKIFSDCLDTEFIIHLEESLQGIRYNKNQFIKNLNLLKEKLPLSVNHIQDIENWISKELN